MPRLRPQPVDGATRFGSPVPDWIEAGRKADAHRVRSLFRQTFDGEAKGVARGRIVEVLRASDGICVLDLWGGGRSADYFVGAGFNVISVENGNLKVADQGHLVSPSRKRRAFERAAEEGGYEGRWGDAADFAHEADVAFLDFCGPWSINVRKTVEACRHMKAVVVTLMAGHDINSGSTTEAERIVAYQAFLKLAFAGPKRQDQVRQPCRLLCKYKGRAGQPVYVFLLARTRLPIRHLSHDERARLHPEKRAEASARWKERYRSDPEFRATQLARAKANRERRLAKPGARERTNANTRAWYARRKATLAELPSSGDP